jgi:hypothetical protein
MLFGSGSLPTISQPSRCLTFPPGLTLTCVSLLISHSHLSCIADHLLDCATGEVTHDPTAPGVSQAAAAFGVATSPASGQQGSAQHDRRKLFSRKMHGAHAGELGSDRMHGACVGGSEAVPMSQLHK